MQNAGENEQTKRGTETTVPERQPARRPLSTRLLLRTLLVHCPSAAEVRHSTARRWRQLRQKPFEKEFEILRFMPPDTRGDFVDAGSNRGQSIDAIRLYHPTVPIAAFEPVPWLARRLTEQYAADPNTRIHSVALGDHEGEISLYTPSYNGFVFDGVTSSDAEMTRAWLEPSLYRFRASKIELTEHICPVRRLDDFGFSPSFMKLDVQGDELDALRGAQATLRAFQPVLLIETPPMDAELLLNSLGYRSNDYDAGVMHLDRRGALNTIYLTDQHLADMRSRGLETVS